MPYDEGLAQRLREILDERDDVIEKKMFGGIAFMVSRNMCVGIIDDTLMARVGPKQYKEALTYPHVREMDFTGKPLKGFIYVSPDGIESDGDLLQWVNLCEQFNTTLPPK